MKLFDSQILHIKELMNNYPKKAISQDCLPWDRMEKGSFIMERDTAIELGGYPKESINIVASSSTHDIFSQGGVFVIGDEKDILQSNKHLSYGKIVLLKTKEIDDSVLYNTIKDLEMVDYRLHLRDIMLRTSTEQFFTNIRISKGAFKNGITLNRIGKAMITSYMDFPYIEDVQIIFIIGDSLLYKELLPTAEKIRSITQALNKLADDMAYDCKSCNLKVICSEVESLREIHKSYIK